MKERCIILGAGGHAKVVIDAINWSGAAAIAGALDSDSARWGSTILDVPIIGGDDMLHSLGSSGACFVVGLGAVRPSPLRQQLYDRALAAGLLPLTVIHSSAVCSRRADIGAGTVVLAGAVVNAGAVVGFNVIVNTGAIVEHDCVVAPHAHIATGARLCGGVNVGGGAMIGAGAVVRQGITVGANALVGAGAMVTRDVPPNVMTFGNPSRIKGFVRCG